MYHDAFYYGTSPADVEIPTQVTSSIAESVTTRLFKKMFRADGILKIRERPSSKTADFFMTILWNGARTDCLVETKASHGWTPNTVQLSQARVQLGVSGNFFNTQLKFACIVYFNIKTIVIFQVN